MSQNTPSSNPVVSVLLPVHNAESTLAAAIESVTTDSAFPFELVVIDDGSTDQTPEIIASFQRPEMVHIQQDHRGIVDALNTGISTARGRYLARMDADDLSLPGRFAAQAAFLDAHPAIGLVACQVQYGGDPILQSGYARYVNWTNQLLSHDQIALHQFVESPLAHPSVMFRSDIPRVHGPYRDGPFPEDYECWLRWLAAGVRMQKLEQPFLRWNDPPNRLSRTDRRYQADAFYQIKADYLARWLKENNPHHPKVWICGAGRKTRIRLAPLIAQGIDIVGFADVAERKHGTNPDGLPVVRYEDLPPPDQCFVLSYVASRGAREAIAHFFKKEGRVPGKHYLLCA